MTPVVRTLLFATIGAFFLQNTLPGLADAFVFIPAAILQRPWTIVSYMFLHGGLSHILFNMLGLFFFGPRVEARIGSREFAVLYFLSGATGALLSFGLALAGLTPAAAIIGASGGIFGIMLAFAWFWPDEPIYIWGVIPVPARILVLVTTALTLWSGFGGRGGGVAHFAHLGGYLGAFLYLKWLTRGQAQFRARATGVNSGGAPRGWRPEAPTPARAPDYAAIDRSRLHELNRQEVDRLLDKISAQGVGALTAQERMFLSNFVPPDDRKPVS